MKGRDKGQGPVTTDTLCVHRGSPMARACVWFCPCIHSQVLLKGIPRWSYWQWEEVIKEMGAINLSPDCSLVFWISCAISMEVLLPMPLKIQGKDWGNKKWTISKYFLEIKNIQPVKNDVSSFCKLLENQDLWTSRESAWWKK